MLTEAVLLRLPCLEELTLWADDGVDDEAIDILAQALVAVSTPHMRD